MLRRFIGRFLNWTGFHEKTLWDWMTILMVPVVVGVGAFWLELRAQAREDERATLQRDLAERLETFQQTREDERNRLQRESLEALAELQEKNEDRRTDLLVQSEENRAQTQRDIEADRNHSEVLREYLDKMSELMIDKELTTADAPTAVRDVARARTLVALRDLDEPRKSLLMQFLRDAELALATTNSPVISFVNADMTSIDLSEVNMRSINLSQASLLNANLINANLRGANLSQSNLILANLSEADLFRASLSGARLFRANLSEANLSEANLSDVRNLTIEQLCATRSLQGLTGLAPELMKQIKEQCPQLLEEPKEEG